MGAPKAWLPFCGETMLARVVRVVRASASTVVVVAARGQDVPPLPSDVRIVCDEVEDCGPLGGLVAGLTALEGEADAVYLSSCDVPLLKPDFVRRVLSLLGDSAVCVPRAAGRLHPLAAAYRIDVLPVVRERFAASRLRMLDLIDALPARVIDSHDLTDADPRLLSLWNINTLEDYDAAVREARKIELR